MLCPLRGSQDDLPPLRGPKREATERAMRRQWWAVARSVDIVTPQPAMLLGERLVVYRTASGKAVVQSRRCPHRGGNLVDGIVHGDSIACPYHGWQFSSTDGRCTHVPSLSDQSKVPAKAVIATYPVIEQWGHIWTVLEQPALPMYDLKEWQSLDLEWLAGPKLDSETGVAVAIENFRDVAHFPFVHEVSMGPTPHIVEPLHVKRNGIDITMERKLEASNGDWANDGDCNMLYHCVAPGLATITFDYAKFGKRIVAGFPSPMAYDHVMIYWGVANERTYKGADIQECLRIEEMVYREDLPIAGALEPREVDWDANYAEYSVPADLFTLNYRRAYGDFVSLALNENRAVA